MPLKYVDVVGAIGRQYIEYPARYLGITDDTGMDYKIGLQAMVYGFGLELAWIDTDLNSERITNAADNQIVFTVTKNF